MFDDYTWMFLAGVLFGWGTKVPFLLKWYREFEAERREMYLISKRILEMMKEMEDK